jgi:sugar diacid utilization regulator
MNITSAVLFYILERQYPVSYPPGPVRSLAIRGIKLIDSAAALEPETLCITDDPAALEGIGDPLSAAFLLIGPAAGMELPERFSEASVAFIREALNPVRILEQTFSWFIALQDWDLRLKDAQFDAAGYAGLFKIVREIFDRPFSLVDRNFFYVAYTANFVEETKLYESGHVPTQMTMERINELLMDGGEYYRVSECREPFLYPSEPAPAQWLCFNIFNGSHYEARICALANTDSPNIDGQLQLVAHFGGYIKKILISVAEDRVAKKQQDPLHRLVRNYLFESADTTEKAAASILEDAGWGITGAWLIVMFHIQDEQEFKYGSLYLCRRLEEDFLQSCAIANVSHICWVLNTSDAAENSGRTVKNVHRNLEQVIAYIVREFNCKAGISDSFTDFFDLRHGHIQAASALRLGQKRDPHVWVYHFADYKTEYMIDRITGELPGDCLLHPAVLTLRDHDRRYGTSFVKTLRELVQARHNMTAAAERLYIHRTTLIRRLEKMQDLAPIDFENPREYFHLVVSLGL